MRRTAVVPGGVVYDLATAELSNLEMNGVA